MKTGVYVSRLGWVLRDRKLPVSELRRRLGQRGHTVSRGALDRLMSERPLRTVDLDVLMPGLEELDADRLERELRRAHPELFDARGRLRQRALERLLLERVAGQQILEGDALRVL